MLGPRSTPTPKFLSRLQESQEHQNCFVALPMRIGVGFGVKYLLELEKNVWVTAGGVPGLHMMAWTF